MIFEFGPVSETLAMSVSSEGKLVKKYNSRFLVGTDMDLTRDQVGAMIGILPGAPHWEWPWATCRDIKIDRMMSRLPCSWWHADYEHSTDAPVPADNSDTAPDLRRVLRTTGTSQQGRNTLFDRLDVLITDAAGSPFDGGVPVTAYLPTITWKRDEPHTSLSQAYTALYSGHLNSLTFMSCDPETLLLEVTSEEKWEGDYHFWTHTYTMTYDPLGWQPKPLNAGLYEKYASGRRRIKESDGTETQEPQPLTPGGKVIPEAARPAACNFVDVDYYPTFAFGTLGLPTT